MKAKLGIRTQDSSLFTNPKIPSTNLVPAFYLPRKTLTHTSFSSKTRVSPLRANIDKQIHETAFPKALGKSGEI